MFLLLFKQLEGQLCNEKLGHWRVLGEIRMIKKLYLMINLQIVAARAVRVESVS